MRQSPFLNKVAGIQVLKTLAQMFSYKFCGFSKNTFFIEHLWTNALQYILQVFKTLKTLFFISICDALRDLVPFVQFKKRKKHPWRSVFLGKLLKAVLLHGCFSRFLNCTYSIKSCKTSHIFLSFVVPSFT